MKTLKAFAVLIALAIPAGCNIDFHCDIVYQGEQVCPSKQGSIQIPNQ